MNELTQLIKQVTHNLPFVTENEDEPRVHPSLGVVSDHLHSQNVQHTVHPSASGGHIEVEHSNFTAPAHGAPLASNRSGQVADHVHNAIQAHEPAKKETEDHLTHSMSGKGSQGRGRDRAVMSDSHHLKIEDHGQKSIIRSAE